MTPVVRSAVILVASVLLWSGCQKTAWDRKYDAMVAATKRQAGASAVRQSVIPLFEKYGATNSVDIPSTEVPSILSSLPIFAEDSTNISVNWIGGSEALMFHIGSGFGHWGIIVCRRGTNSISDKWMVERITPWGDGVFFYRQ
jgi:hypothetical protein